MRTNVPRALRALRLRQRWRQVDLAARASLSRDAVSRAETGGLESLTLRSLGRLADAVGATLLVELRWQGAELDRLTDRVHARLQDRVARRLGGAGWTVAAEVSFNHYGDRGSCDLLALHASGALLVVEVKSRLGDLQETLRRLDVKARLGATIAGELGWPRPISVSRALVVANGTSARRTIRQHAALFSAFDQPGVGLARWLLAPTPGRALLWFEKVPDSDGAGVTDVKRVRRPVTAGPRRQ